MLKSNNRSHRISADIVVLTVIESEYVAALAAFGINIIRDARKEQALFGHRFYSAKVSSIHCGELKVWFGLIGEARNVVCANFCRDIFELFEISQFCALVGIAAGNPDEVSYGDVVGASSVYDVEGGRAEPHQTLIRDEPYRLMREVRGIFHGFNPDRTDWLAHRDALLSTLRAVRVRVPGEAIKSKPKYKRGIVVAGEKLRRDKPFSSLVDRLGDRVLAIEMEGSGFAAACESKRIPWLIFRGISDYGDMNKRDFWQSISAFHAALAARNFMEKNWHPISPKR